MKRVDAVNSKAFLETVPVGAHGIVHFWNQIFRSEAIERFSTLVNLHESLLPFYRGPTPLHWLVANGERTGGCTLHRVAPKIDAGEILYQEAWSMEGAFDPRSLHDGNRAAIRRAFTLWLEHLYAEKDYVPRVVDAGACYRDHVDYRGRPNQRMERRVATAKVRRG